MNVYRSHRFAIIHMNEMTVFDHLEQARHLYLQR